MKIELFDIKKIKPYYKNPRRNDRSIEYVANSLKEFGFQQPIVVDKNLEIVVGHTRYAAAKQLGYLEIPVLVAEDLNEDQIKSYRLADNKTHEYSVWDDNLLGQELRDLLDNNSINEVSFLTAFSEIEIEKLLKDNLYSTDLESELKQSNNKFSERRVGILFLKNSYVNRGLATAVNGWIEWGLRNNVVVDLISNSDDLYNNQFSRYQAVAEWISPDQHYSDEDLNPTQTQGDTNDFETYEDDTNLIASEVSLKDDEIVLRYPIIRLADTTQLRDSLILALSRHTYDALIINTVDVLFAVLSMGLHCEMSNLYYITHSEDDLGLGNRKYFTSLTHSLLKDSGIKVLCQSQRTQKLFLASSGFDGDQVDVSPLHLGQPEFLEFKEQDRKGVLFIGPYEDRKNPEVFIDACKQTKLPALVITPSRSSADKFKKRLLKEGIEHEIYYSLTGKNKVEIMKRAAVAVIPSKEETFCYTALEAAHCCPTIIPLERDWTQAHKDWCIRVSFNDIPNAVKQYYGQPLSAQTKQALIEYTKNADAKLLSLITTPKSRFPANNAFTKWLKDKSEAKLSEFYQNRPSIVLDELYMANKLKDHLDYAVIHTRDSTWFKRLK